MSTSNEDPQSSYHFAPSENQFTLQEKFAGERFVVEGLLRYVLSKEIDPYLNVGAEAAFRSVLYHTLASAAEQLQEVTVALEKFTQPQPQNTRLLYPQRKYTPPGATEAGVVGAERALLSILEHVGPDKTSLQGLAKNHLAVLTTAITHLSEQMTKFDELEQTRHEQSAALQQQEAELRLELPIEYKQLKEAIDHLHVGIENIANLGKLREICVRLAAWLPETGNVWPFIYREENSIVVSTNSDHTFFGDAEDLLAYLNHCLQRTQVSPLTQADFVEIHHRAILVEQHCRELIIPLQTISQKILAAYNAVLTFVSSQNLNQFSYNYRNSLQDAKFRQTCKESIETLIEKFQSLRADLIDHHYQTETDPKILLRLDQLIGAVKDRREESHDKTLQVLHQLSLLKKILEFFTTADILAPMYNLTAPDYLARVIAVAQHSITLLEKLSSSTSSNTAAA